MQKISYLESDRRREVHEEMAALEKPVFGRPLRNAGLAEGQSAHLEATLTPVNDATMKVEWFYNGRPIPQGKETWNSRQWEDSYVGIREVWERNLGGGSKYRSSDSIQVL